MDVQRTFPFWCLLLVAPSPLLVASRAGGLFCLTGIACPHLLVPPPARHSLFGRGSASLARLARSDQLIHRTGRTRIPPAAAQAHELRSLFVRTWRRVQSEREDGQAVAAQRELDVALE